MLKKYLMILQMKQRNIISRKDMAKELLLEVKLLAKNIVTG